MRTCKWCFRTGEGNAGDYYHEHECHAKDVRRRLALNSDERKRLEAELEEAEYVGD